MSAGGGGGERKKDEVAEGGGGDASPVLGHKRKMLKGRAIAGGGENRPKKRFFRTRAHINPLNSGCFICPPHPDAFQWEQMFPIMREAGGGEGEGGEGGEKGAKVQVLDIGCGFGGLLLQMAPLLEPGVLACGMEIRSPVADFVRLAILNARAKGEKGAEQIGVLRTNTMLYLQHLIGKAMLRRVFVCFPDPQFKRTTHRRRIVSPALLDEYAYMLREGGRVYTITDVEDVHVWMRDHGLEHPYFEPVPESDLEDDPWLPIMKLTDEGKKAKREGRPHLVAVFRRVSDEKADEKAAKTPFFNGYYGGVGRPREKA